MKSLVAQYRLAISASIFCLSALSSAGIATTHAQLNLSFPPRMQNSTPTMLVEDESATVVGSWFGEIRSDRGTLQARLILSDDGSYRGSVTISITELGETRNEQEDSQGTWKTENGVLILTSPDGVSIDRYTFQLLNGQLILREMNDGGAEIRMTKNSAQSPILPQVLPPEQPQLPSAPQLPAVPLMPTVPSQLPAVPQPGQPGQPGVVNSDPVVGTWFASSMTANGRIELVFEIRHDGQYSFQIMALTPSGSQQMAGQGRWSRQGNALRFVGDAGTEVIPFVVRGDTMTLDYSNNGGFIAMVSKQPGQGTIRPAGPASNPAGFSQQ